MNFCNLKYWNNEPCVVIDEGSFAIVSHIFVPPQVILKIRC
jgi:hypothetical protein